MKNLFLTTILVFGLAVNARPITFNKTIEKPTNIETVAEVDTFCKLIQQGNFEAVKGMIEAGININNKSAGMTPIMYAARQNRVKIVKLLITHNADLSIKSKRGYTALQYAKMSKAYDAHKIISNELNAKKHKRAV